MNLRRLTTPTPPILYSYVADVALDSHTSPKIIQLTLHQSKTDQFRKGSHIFLGVTSHYVCPVQALLQYLKNRGSRPGPLFILTNRKALTGSMLRTAIKKALKELNLNPSSIPTASESEQLHQPNKPASAILT